MRPDVSGVRFPDAPPVPVRSGVRSNATAVRSDRETCPETSPDATPDTGGTSRVPLSGAVALPGRGGVDPFKRSGDGRAPIIRTWRSCCTALVAQAGPHLPFGASHRRAGGLGHPYPWHTEVWRVSQHYPQSARREIWFL